MTRLFVAIVVMVVLALTFCLGSSSVAQQAGDDLVMTKVYRRTDHATQYVYRSFKTTLATMGPVISETMNQFDAKMKSGDIRINGAPIFVYEGADGSMDKEFEIKIGFPVSADQKPVPDFELMELPAFESMSSVYCGSMQNMHAAYGRLFADVATWPGKPTGTTRESYFYWEGADSPNNVTLISAGIEVNAAGGR